MVKTLDVTMPAGEGVVAFFDNNEAVGFEPQFEVFDDFSSDGLVFDDATIEITLVRGFKLRL